MKSRARRPPMTAAVLRGLVDLATLIEAGSPDDVLGESLVGIENRRRWADIRRACRWIRLEQAKLSAEVTK